MDIKIGDRDITELSRDELIALIRQWAPIVMQTNKVAATVKVKFPGAEEVVTRIGEKTKPSG